jgi:two-component system, OmpR family, phosphate regulon sensor histidine kinase PhoR
VQVFQNLIQNALKYAASGKVVRVEATRTPETGRQPAQFRIAVIDRGPGIAVQHLPRLTERFYRVDVASSREKGGTGLGLAIVKHILARHRGELLITSDLGKGSRFTVVLPEADRP